MDTGVKLMFEARIYSIDNPGYQIVEANTLETLKEKCQKFIERSNVYVIKVYKLEGVGWLKNESVKELL